MGFRKKRRSNKINLLEMSEQEQSELVSEVRTRLRQRALEAKLCQSLLEAEELTINGQVVYESSQPLEGLSRDDIFRWSRDP